MSSPRPPRPPTPIVLAAAAFAALLTAGATAQDAPAPATERDVAELMASLAEARRALDFEPARARLADVAKRVADEALAVRLATASADFLAEADLWKRLLAWMNEQSKQAHPVRWPGSEVLVVAQALPDRAELKLEDGGDAAADVLAKRPWSAVAPADALALLEKIEWPPLGRIEVARFAYWRGFSSRAEDQLHKAVEADATTKDDADALLSRERHEELPRGGYEWHRGQFLPAPEVNRRRFLEDVAQKVERTLGAAAPIRHAETLDAPARALDAFAPALEVATRTIVAELGALYEPPRDWIRSYRRSTLLREQRLQQDEAWKKLAKTALDLIAVYDKPQQPKVDEFRKQLQEKWELALTLRHNDESQIDKLPQEQAEATLARLELLEPALDALMRYRREFHGPVAAPFPEVSPQGAKVHVLPGRAFSGLEEFAWTLLQWKAGRIVQFMQRCEELERAADSLTPWERIVLRDFHHDALDEYDRRVLTSADPEEFACVVATNAYRRTLQLPPFELDERVVVAARGHSQEMKDLGYFGHDSPTNGLHSPSERVQAAGYGGGAGENCYAGGGGGRGAFDGWYHSPGHHRGMVCGSPHVGVGADTTHGLWTQNFAGSDWGWRARYVETTAAEDAVIADAVTKLARAKQESCRAEIERLVALGMKALPMTARALTALRNDASSERRSNSTRLARAVAIAAVETGVPQATDLAIETLLALLQDGAASVRGDANRALQHVTGKDFGFNFAAEAAARAAAATRWREWWKLARAGFTPRLETKREELEPFDAAAPLAKSTATRQSPDAPLKVFSPEERFALAHRLGGSRKTEAAVASALDWLARHQGADGSFGAQAFHSRCKGEGCDGAGAFDFEIGMTGLALLCFEHAGNTIELGRYRDVVKKGLDFLVSRMQGHGKWKALSGGWYMYQHALATQALVEGYGTSGDPFLKKAAQDAVDFLIFAQNPVIGGWRYEARMDCDTSVTGWVVLALCSANDARLRVAGFDGTRRFLDSVTQKGYWRVGYQNPLDAATLEPRLTAVGLLIRQALGCRANHPALGIEAEFCLTQLPRAEFMDLYFDYYATLGLFQVGGEQWKRWNEAMVPALLERIHAPDEGCRRGSFDSQGAHSGMGGRLYATALSCLMLEVYYRYDKFPEVRSVAVTGTPAELAAPLLAQLGTGHDDVTRAVAIARIAEELGTAAQAPLVAFLRAPGDLAARQDAAQALARVATAAVLTDLLGLMDDPDAVIREQLGRGITRAASSDCVGDLIQRLEDPRAHVRIFAARALGTLGDAAAIGPLVARQAGEADGGVKNEFAAAIRALSTRSALDRLLDDAGYGTNDPVRRSELRDALALLQNGTLADKLLAAKTKQAPAYAACVKILKEQGRLGVAPFLIAALELDDVEARTQADQLLCALSGRNFQFPAAGEIHARRDGAQRWQAWWKQAREIFVGGAK